MKTPSWDELVFKNRNRSYGAYVLRKEYPSALAASFVFMLVVITLLFAASPAAVKLARNIIRGDKVVKKVVYVIELPEEWAKPRSAKPEVVVQPGVSNNKPSQNK
jgi:protein TonB